MLRENLDTVLKDLLEFKPTEHIASKYPGAHLDLEDNFLNLDLPSFEVLQDIENKPKEKREKDFRGRCLTNNKNNTEMLNRIRRYLDFKSKYISKQIKKTIKNNKFNRLRLTKLNTKVPNNDRLKKSVGGPIKTKEIRHGRKLLMFYKAKKKRQDMEALSINKENLLEDVNQSNDDPANGDAAMKARFLFKSCMNYNILQKRSHQPLLDLLNHFGGWPILQENWDSSKFDWLELMARLRLYNNDILISQWVGPDIKKSDEFVIQFDQTSLGKYVKV